MRIVAAFIALVVLVGSAEAATDVTEPNRIPIEWGKTSVTKKIVRIMRRNGVHACTGTVVGRTTVLTAAHCIHDRDKFLDSSKFYIEIYSGRRFEIERFWVSKGHIDSMRGDPKDYKYDIGLIYTEENISGHTAGSMHIDRKYMRRGSNNVGLVAFHSNKIDLFAQNCLGRYTLNVLGLVEWSFWEKSTLYHRCRREKGSSGAPLFLVNNGIEKLWKDDHPGVFAIHLGARSLSWIIVPDTDTSWPEHKELGRGIRIKKTPWYNSEGDTNLRRLIDKNN